MTETTKTTKNRVPTFDSKAIAEACKEKSWQDVQADFGCSRATVSNACHVYGVPQYSKARSKAQLLGSYLTENPTATLREVSVLLDMSTITIRKYCQKYGFAAPPLGEKRVASQSTFEVVAHLMRGMNQADIAGELFMSRQRVQQIHKAAEAAGILPKYHRDKQDDDETSPSARALASSKYPYSPAPWSIVCEDIADCNNVFVATTTGEVESEIEKANLALLVRAPELVESLANVTAALEECLVRFRLDMFAADFAAWEKMSQDARTLIAEVRGVNDELA